MTLRDYQLEAIALLDAAVADGSRAPLLVMPTGSGKTHLAAELIRRGLADHRRSLFLAPRRELVTQTCATLDAAGMDYGVHLAGVDALRRTYAPVQVASVDTLLSRMIRRQRLVLPPFDLVLVDEAHLSITAARARLLDFWPEALRIGLTATPTRKDGRALGMLYDRLIEPTTVAKLTAAGYLAPARYFSVAEPDLERVRITAGDFNARDLDAAMNAPALVGDIVSTWLQRAADRRTVVFCSSIAHSVAVAEAFQRAGVAAEHVDAATPQDDRAATFARFLDGRTQVLTNCFIASYGFDCPPVSAVVLARPTRSLMLYLQMIGRGLRIAPDKADCLVLDHSGCVHLHGFAHDERLWTLDGEHALAESESTPKERGERDRIDCPECAAVFAGTRTCPECGYYLAPRGKVVETLDGELVEIGATLEPDAQDLLAFYLELRGLGVERGWKPGAAAQKFRERHGHFPPWAWNDSPPLTPSLATRRWQKSREIAWRKGRRAA